jgi:hypothetical protein
MATFKVKKEKDSISLEVSVPELTRSNPVRESINRQRAFNYLLGEGFPVVGFLSGPHDVSNRGGPAATGIFIFARSGAPAPAPEVKKDEESKKDLTPPQQPAIIGEQPRKRKRVKRDSETGNKTIS